MKTSLTFLDSVRWRRVICWSGILGVSLAIFLAEFLGMTSVQLISAHTKTTKRLGALSMDMTLELHAYGMGFSNNRITFDLTGLVLPPVEYPDIYLHKSTFGRLALHPNITQAMLATLLTDPSTIKDFFVPAKSDNIEGNSLYICSIVLFIVWFVVLALLAYGNLTDETYNGLRYIGLGLHLLLVLFTTLALYTTTTNMPKTSEYTQNNSFEVGFYLHIALFVVHLLGAWLIQLYDWLLERSKRIPEQVADVGTALAQQTNSVLGRL